MKLDVVKLRVFAKSKIYGLFKGGSFKCKGYKNVTEEGCNLSFFKNVAF